MLLGTNFSGYIGDFIIFVIFKLYLEKPILKLKFVSLRLKYGSMVSHVYE